VGGDRDRNGVGCITGRKRRPGPDPDTETFSRGPRRLCARLCNITGIGGTSGRSTPTSAATNRLTGTGTAYDPAGNLTAWNGATYQYDGFNQMTRMTNGGEDWLYLYTADDERLWSYSLNANFSRWTVRDLSGKVLREWENHQNQYWGIAADTLYRDGQLLAAETGNGRKHFHLDHLGTPRLLTNAVGQKLAYHVYYPFGEEATEFDQDRERMKFTGHERDLGNLAGAGDDLDYMHARFCSPWTGRFLSVDPLASAKHGLPQSWNRYSYSLGNPVKYFDPDGLETMLVYGLQTSENLFGPLVSGLFAAYRL
jgi:RHS repeat-associated protein